MRIYSLNKAFERVEVKWPDVLRATQRIQTFFNEIEKRFVERDELIQILKYAMLLQEHVLVWGPPGAAKTAVADVVITNIKGAKFWSSDLSRFTVDTHVFGNFDMLKAQETGQFHHQTEGSLLEANFANLGEFLDANIALLRSLLRVLNEREFLRGPQHLQVPLMTAFANTNLNPTQTGSRSKELEAVLDRFLFWDSVDYLKSPGSRITMLTNFLERKYDGELPELTIEDVLLVSGTVLTNNLLTNEYILGAYEQLCREFAERRGYPITDRRFNKSAQIMEANALLRGAQLVSWEDLSSVKYALADRREHLDIFNEILEKVIEVWSEKESKHDIDHEVQALEAISMNFPKIDVSTATDAELVGFNRELRNIKHKLHLFNTTTAKATQKKQELSDKVDNLIRKCMVLINKTN